MSKTLDLYYNNPKFCGVLVEYRGKIGYFTLKSLDLFRKLKSFIMRTEPTKKGYKVWLASKEMEDFINCANSASTRKDMTERLTIAVTLAGRAGLRAFEIGNARDEHKTDNNSTLTVPEGKGGKYREVPMPKSIALLKFDSYLTNPATGRGVTVTTIENWIRMIGKEYHRRYDDEDALKITPHDLRRSWGTLLTEMTDPVLPNDIIMKWGGWTSRPVFDKHYLNVGSPDYEAEQRSKIPWL